MERVEITDIRDIGTCSSTVEEQETIITLVRKENYVDIWTCDNTMITKLSRVMKTYPDTWKCFEGGRDSKVMFTVTILDVLRKQFHLEAEIQSLESQKSWRIIKKNLSKIKIV